MKKKILETYRDEIEIQSSTLQEALVNGEGKLVETPKRTYLQIRIPVRTQLVKDAAERFWER